MTYAHKITGNHPIKLKDYDADYEAGLDREEGEEELARLCEELTRLQELLYAAADHAVLIVLQGRDTSGKDGTIKTVMGPLNSLGCNVASFKVPTEKELSHDFLWRIHQHAPAKGEITIFNRSHYEDVLIVRVEELAPLADVERRYDQINAFEKLLTENGTTVLKFMLHLSREEQRKRFLDRLNETDKRWKFNPDDLQKRDRWDEYQAAYEVMLDRCSTEWAPWYVIPSDRKWARNAIVAAIVRQTLEDMDPQPHQPDWDPKDFKVD